MKAVILGAGLAGLIANAHLRKKYDTIVLEKDNYGGLLKTKKIKGYQFDMTGHLIHSLNNEFLKFLKSTGIGIEKIKRNAAVFYENKYIPYPFQLNFKYLKPAIRNKIINEILKIPQSEFSKGANFIEWIQSIFGKTLTEIFFIPYNEKLLKTNLHNIHSSWYLKYMPVADKLEIIRSLKKEEDVGYNAYFYYPEVGNIQILVDKMYELFKNNILLDQEISHIDIENKIVFTQRDNFPYDILISTIPYKNFLQYAQISYNYNIDFVNVYDLNIGVSKANFPYHWVYFPEEKYSFYRIGSFSNISKKTVPPHKSSFYIEVSYRDKKINSEKILNEIEQLGIFNMNDIEIMDENYIEYAYPIYNMDINKLREHQKVLANKSIYFWGRSGSHSYLSMSDLFNFKLF